MSIKCMWVIFVRIMYVFIVIEPLTAFILGIILFNDYLLNGK